jgi:hypothetical protein
MDKQKTSPEITPTNTSTGSIVVAAERDGCHGDFFLSPSSAGALLLFRRTLAL